MSAAPSSGAWRPAMPFDFLLQAEDADRPPGYRATCDPDRLATASSTDSSHCAQSWPGSHIIKSMLTLSNPAARAASTACLAAVGGMQPAQPLQFLISKRLHAEAETIDTRFTKLFQQLQVTVSGLASSVISASASRSSDLRLSSTIASISAGVSSDGVPPPKYSVSANRGRRRPCSVRKRPTHLLQQRVHEARFQRFVEQPSIEVAVIADGAAERDVDVQTGDWGLGIRD